MTSNTILAVDPSLNGYGWAIFINQKLIECGCITSNPYKDLKQSESDTLRLSSMSSFLSKLITLYSPTLLVFEDPAGSKSSRAIQALALVKGMTVALAASHKIDVAYLRAKQAKQIICADSNATKEQMQEKVIELQPIFSSLVSKCNKFETFGASDAVSIGEAYFALQANTEN